MKFLYGAPALIHKGALILGDTHFGIEKRLREKGIYDSQFSARLCESIKKLISNYKVKKIIFLGDVKEDITMLDKTIIKMLSELSEIAEITIIRGNHDGGIEKFTTAKIFSSDGIIYKDIGLFHGHSWPSEKLMSCKYIICGHQHPMISIKDRNGKHHIESAWIIAPVNKKKMMEKYLEYNHYIKLILMPAFNPIVGSPINFSSEKQLGPLLNNKLFKLHDALVFRLDGTNLGRLKNLLKRDSFKSDLMGKGKRRGRERLERCGSCGRVMPRDKAVAYTRRTFYSTDLKGDENVTYSDFRNMYYCISCAKHRKIFEKKKQQAQRRRESGLYG